jgi:hypothetical protein
MVTPTSVEYEQCFSVLVAWLARHQHVAMYFDSV